MPGFQLMEKDNETSMADRLYDVIDFVDEPCNDMGQEH